MRCKNCGGEILFKNEQFICQNCGRTFEVDGFYENVEVFICYEEYDAQGHRTKDSIIAQEVYNKLKANKITAFYERISVDGITGDALMKMKHVAIKNSKVIVVLGASVKNFIEIEKKYGQYFTGKTVIPFCVDVNPRDIPKTMSTKQAINFALIGWDKTLVTGVYNLLGREKEIETSTLYGKRRKKRGVLFVVAAVLVAALGIAAFWMFDKPEEETKTNIPLQEEPQMPTEQEIYNRATELWNSEKFQEALTLFLQIPEHPNSANMVKQIYAKYEGYYKKDDTSIHLEISENVRAEIEITMVVNDTIVKITESASVSANIIMCDYVDNHQKAGSIKLILENAGVRLQYSKDTEESMEETFFEISGKSDQPILQLDAETLFKWMENKYTQSQIMALGYELEDVKNMCFIQEVETDENKLYRIKGTDVYLSMIGRYYYENEFYETKDRVLFGIAAPAKLIAPSLIGQACSPQVENNVIYWPKGCLYHDSVVAYFNSNFWGDSETQISDNTQIGVVLKIDLLKDDWEDLISSIHR